MDRPDVRYAHNGEVAIAYQVFGEGPISLVCVPGFISNLYWNWELPEFSRMLTGLGSFARVVILDRRGVGLSDRLYPQRPSVFGGGDGRRGYCHGRGGHRTGSGVRVAKRCDPRG